jgi:integrase/recombinase XerD
MAETDFARHVAGFLSRYLPGQRNLSTNTIASYRDAVKLLLVFCKTDRKMKPDRIRISDISPELLTDYLGWLERERHCGVATRNQRLAAFKSFFHYVAAVEPEHLLNCQRILGLPMKKLARRPMSFFSPEGLHLLLSQPDTTTPKGRRDHALLVLLYDSAARVQEICDLRVRDVRLEQPATVTLHGKGRKARVVPITTKTASIMEVYLREKGWIGENGALDFPVFISNRKCKLTRAGVAHILAKHVRTMSLTDGHHVPASVSPHCLRHTKAVHLLRSGVALIYIRDFLGHASVTTTEIYAKVDVEQKRKALEGAYEVPSQQIVPEWETNKGLMSWLSELCR